MDSPPPKEVAPCPPHPIPQCKCSFLLGIKCQSQFPSFLYVALGQEGPWREEEAPGQGGRTQASLGRGILLCAEVWARATQAL